MFEHLDDLVTELERIEASWPDLYADGDQAKITAANRRVKELTPVVDGYRAYRSAEADIASARELLK
ncbi:MAG TPA: peptide chain release factor 1, partial [Acidimicrobiia bacterium]